MRVECTCAVCGRVFLLSASHAAKRRTCSIACRERHPDRYRTPPGPRLERTCVRCGTAFYLPPSLTKGGRGRYCSLACYHPPGDEWARIERWTDRSGVCHVWTGAVTGPGYPEITIDGQMHRVHRLVLERKLGRPIAPGLVARHMCEGLYAAGDTSYRRCINPSHLEEGTRKQNAQDRVDAGHGARPPTV